MTIQEIAERADVSIATVSRVLNNKGNVSKKNRDRVFAVLSNEKNSNNLSLADLSCKTILMCIPTFTNPFTEQVIKGVLASTSKHGYQVFFYCISEFSQSFSTYAKIFTSGTYSGIILQSPVLDSNFIADLSIRFPVVMCSEYCDESNISFVSVDNKSAARKAVQYLISTGCKKIAMMNTSLDKLHSKYRELGYRKALQDAGLPIDENRIVHISSIDYSLALSFAKHLLTLPDRPDGIFAISDVYAAAAINVSKEMGLRIPEDISVVGFDDIDIATISHPSITTVRQPTYHLGFQSCELLIDQIEHSANVKQLVLDTELIIRNSTG